jgi:hypothetical protein
MLTYMTYAAGAGMCGESCAAEGLWELRAARAGERLLLLPL